MEISKSSRAMGSDVGRWNMSKYEEYEVVEVRKKY